MTTENEVVEIVEDKLFDAGIEVRIISLSIIDEGERRRVDYGPMEELVESIKQYGIIQPIAVCVCGSETLPFTLLAGGRRFRAAALAGLEEIPARIYPRQLTDLELRCVELEENIQRKDLSWIEKSALTKEIHDTRIAMFGPKISTSPNAEGWSARDTARLLGRSHTPVNQDLQLAQAVETFKEVAWDKIPNRQEALKTVRKMQEGVVRRELAKRAVAKTSGKPADGESAATIFRRRLIESYMIGDCLEAMKKLEPESFDFIEIDPPYAIDLDEQKRLNDCVGYHEIEQSSYVNFMTNVLNEAYRLAKPGAWLVLWFGPEPWFEPLFKMMTAAGWTGKRIPAIWTKKNGQTMQPNYNLANAYEMFFYARKGEGVLSLPGRLNVFDFAPVPAPKKYHPTQRPLELMREVVRTFSFENARILVPFAGSGATILASALEKRQAFGYDLQSEYRESFVLEVTNLF